MVQLSLTILGATGSIGCNTLEVAALHPQRYRIHALSAHRNVEKLAQQCMRFLPRYAVVSCPEDASRLAGMLKGTGCDRVTQILSGAQSLCQVAASADTDVVMAAIVGAAGLEPTLAAAQAGKRVLLANKEALVMSGALLMDAVRASGAQLLPVDSEHNAVFQSLPRTPGRGLASSGVSRITLTASGGPFLHRPLSELADVTPDEACRHPNWRMGRKISVDSATMMNKGLELIEACWLFDAQPEQVEIVIHPESIVHSLVSYVDGSVIAQLGCPDMRVPIAHALAYPERIASGAPQLSLAQVGALRFLELDMERFPAVALAYRAIKAGGTCPAVLNAANEVAVEAFLGARLRFDRIPAFIEQVLDAVPAQPATTLAAVLSADAKARELAGRLLSGQGGKAQ
ncbi:MAG: 1-deoxy-D-xylulose-5-phosphate reductoisomerase [Betaproteobacteria bacterium]|nr:1-deoxy-D-xylulose-5-phosphate reductoisomerase [Betaproteobacteria bacterium]